MSKITDIFRNYYSQCEEKYAIAYHARKAACRIINCRTEAMGGHVQECPDGHHSQIWFNSCKHRMCPQCSEIDKERWIQKQSEKTLNTHHHHVVFTIPHEFNRLWLLNPKKMTGILFKAAKEALFCMVEDERFLEAYPGMIAILQTWGENLAFHPHLHCLVTGGGLTEEGNWKKSNENFLIPVKGRGLMSVFRAKFIDKVRKLVEKEELEKDDIRTYEEIKEMLDQLKKKDWNIFIDEEPVYGNGVIKYLGRYIKGGPISDERIISYDENEVKFYYKDNKNDSKKKVITLATEEFIRRFLLHTPPKHLKVVRYYGLYSSAKREELISCRKKFGQGEIDYPEDISWQDYCKNQGHENVGVCPVCGKELVKGEEFDAGKLDILLLMMGKELKEDLTLKDRKKLA